MPTPMPRPTTDRPATTARRWRPGLRLQMQLIAGLLMLGFASLVLTLQLRTLRDSVMEETLAANRVASQLLDRTAWVYAAQGIGAMQAFLEGLGRIRSNDVLLYDQQERLVYRSPPSPYKQGQDAPAWFSALIAPPSTHRSIQFPDGRLEVHANASRSVLDAWDSLWRLSLIAVAALLATAALVHAAVGRAVRPFAHIVDGLQALQDGRLDTRLPPLPGREASAIAEAFNRMAEQLARQWETERRALRAERQLSDSRALGHWMAQHIEAERKLIARELHDEFGQSVTAMRSMATAIAGRCVSSDPTSAEAARVIADEAARLYDAMHGIIPRLAPLVLDAFGLIEALADLLERTRRSQPGLRLELQQALDPERTPIGAEAALALYRTAQEGVTNALRHGEAGHIRLCLDGTADRLRLSVQDNGRGLPEALRTGRPSSDAADPAHADDAADPAPASPPGHFGLSWLAERAAALGGRLHLRPADPGPGVWLTVELPLDPADRPQATAPERQPPAPGR